MEMEFNIKCKMEKRWIPHFCSMLERMEHNGNIGRSEIVSLYSDGDGDFRPTFDYDIIFEKVKPRKKNGKEIYDAG